MGSALCRSQSGGRFVSFKRRLVPAAEAVKDGVEWTLWREENEQPSLVSVFRVPLTPAPGQVDFILAALKGWLLDGWTPEQAKAIAATLPSAGSAEVPATTTTQQQD
jgi:hypothetical protein